MDTSIRRQSPAGPMIEGHPACRVAHVITMQISIQVACLALLTGIWPLQQWHGKANRKVRYAVP